MGTLPFLYLYFLLTVTSSGVQGSNVDLFWNLYDAVLSGGRILHDVAEGVGAVSKAIKAIDMFLESTSEMKKLAANDDSKADDAAEATAAAADKKATTETLEQQKIPAQAPSPAPELDTATPNFSGCGALGFHIRDESLPITRLTECCGTHDTCYSSACRVSKRDCDSKLRSCLFSVCEDKTTIDRAKYKPCKGAAKLLFSGTMALSFQQYNTAQEKLSCKSKPKEKWRGRG